MALPLFFIIMDFHYGLEYLSTIYSTQELSSLLHVLGKAFPLLMSLEIWISK
jgi:hypothetical protein